MGRIFREIISVYASFCSKVYVVAVVTLMLCGTHSCVTLLKTSMHSSRMRTAYLLTVSGGGGGSAQPRGFCPTLGSAQPGGSAQPRGSLLNPGGSASGGGSAQSRGKGSAQPWRDLHPGGSAQSRGSAQPGGSASMGGSADLPPPVIRMTHRCKNITLPQTSFAGGNNAKLWRLALWLTDTESQG